MRLMSLRRRQVQAGVDDHQHNRQLADDVEDELDGIAELEIAIEAGEVSDERPDQQERDHQRQVVAEGIDSRQVLAEELEMHQEAAQQIGRRRRRRTSPPGRAAA